MSDNHIFLLISSGVLNEQALMSYVQLHLAHVAVFCLTTIHSLSITFNPTLGRASLEPVPADTGVSGSGGGGVCGGGGTGHEFITGSRSTDAGRTPDPQPLCAEPSYRETTVRTTAPPTFSSLFSHGRFAEHTHTWDIWQASAVYHREAATRKAGESFVLT